MAIETELDIATIELHYLGLKNNPSGRVFLPMSTLQTIKMDKLQSMFDREFLDDGDEERLSLLKEKILASSTIAIEIYPEYDFELSPEILHVYLQIKEGKEESIFICVLSTLNSVKRELNRLPLAGYETSYFQVVGPIMSKASITSAIENWILRIFPELNNYSVPQIILCHNGLFDNPEQGVEKHVENGTVWFSKKAPTIEKIKLNIINNRKF